VEKLSGFFSKVWHWLGCRDAGLIVVGFVLGAVLQNVLLGDWGSAAFGAFLAAGIMFLQRIKVPA